MKTLRASLVVLLIAGMTAAIYGQVGAHPFIGFDDNDYVFANYHVRGGLSAEGASWAFAAFHANNWHPLTWLSHMADVSLFGLDAGRHHLVNVLLHGLNAALLFLVLAAMTGATWRSAFVAALFAAHPLHVESVAWIAERKDVLSAFFWLLSTGAYAHYARSPGWRRYLGVACLFALGLLSKPMVVTLPFAFLLLDWWPLGRLRGGSAGRLVLEKVPLLLMSAASCAVTLLAQGDGGAVMTLESVPAGYRAANAVVSYLRYLAMAAWPSSLAVYYPLSLRDLQAWNVIGSGVALGAISAAAALARRRCPPLLVGWLWYLGTLVPVIGLAQVGSQAIADRYTYVPLTGIFLAAAWGTLHLFEGRRFGRPALALAAVLLLAASTAAARTQVAYWRDSIALFTRTLEVTEGNWLVWYNLGTSHWALGHHPEAIACYRESLRINPHYALARNSLAEALKVADRIAVMANDSGAALEREGRYREAIACYEKAVRTKPDFADAWYNLAVACRKAGEAARAAEAFSAAIRAGAGRREPGPGEAPAGARGAPAPQFP